MTESFFYNAANIATKTGYATMRKRYAQTGSWEKYWERYGTSDVNPDKAWRDMESRGINLLLCNEPDYPALLNEIPNPPFGIYYKGLLKPLASEMNIAIVGTRKATITGKNLSTEFAVTLARIGCVVVSGLAFGIDAAAHTGALAASAPTVAVLANGLDEIYPSSHARLAAHIIEKGGVLVSEYPLGSPPLAHRFLERNRIVSGLSRAILVVEAPERSGVLTTARFAMEQNRDLFVVPGPVNHSNYVASHGLIRNGATLVASPQNLLEDLGFQVDAAMLPAHGDTPDEEKILAAIRDAGNPLTIDEIIEAATLTSSIVNQNLTTLILKNVLREDGDRYTLR